MKKYPILKHLINNDLVVKVIGKDLKFINEFQKKEFILNKNLLNIHLKKNIDEKEFKLIIIDLINKLNPNNENDKGIISLLKHHIKN